MAFKCSWHSPQAVRALLKWLPNINRKHFFNWQLLSQNAMEGRLQFLLTLSILSRAALWHMISATEKRRNKKRDQKPELQVSWELYPLWVSLLRLGHVAEGKRKGISKGNNFLFLSILYSSWEALRGHVGCSYICSLLDQLDPPTLCSSQFVLFGNKTNVERPQNSSYGLRQ